MFFKFVKEVSEPVKCYGGEMLSTGDTVEYSGFFESKAKKSPHFEEVKKKPRATKTKAEVAETMEPVASIGDFSDADLGVNDGDTETNS